MNHPEHVHAEAVSSLSDEAGQTLVEYALILLLVVIVVIALLGGVGRTTNNTYSTINSGVTCAVGG